MKHRYQWSLKHTLGACVLLFGTATLFAVSAGAEPVRSSGDVLGSHIITERGRDGTTRQSIKYAYLGDFLDARMPRVRGSAITEEIVGKRTKQSRTFATADGKRVVEIIGGAPQYYEDPAGTWWHVEYATTTEAQFKKLKKAPEHGTTAAVRWINQAFAASGTFYPDGNPGTSSFDGWVEYNPGPGGGTWEATRDATTAAASSDSGTVGYTSTGKNGMNSGFVIDRLITGFDTSSIEEGSTIDAATTSLYAVTWHVRDDDGNDFVAIVRPSPASSTAVSAGDFDAFSGLTGAMDEGSGRIDMSSGLTSGSYNDFVLNSTGRGWINTSGTTWLGAAEGHDILDDPFSASGSNYYNTVVWSMAEETGTSQDPKLIITYTPPNAAPSAPTALWTEGTTTPAYVSTTTPSFSGIYNDPNSGDQAGSYRVQVSATTSFDGALLWDSGKVAMAMTTEGSRVPDIKYAGSALMYNGSTAHWRIKFWDDEDAEGAWSSSSSFTMGVICAPTP